MICTMIVTGVDGGDLPTGYKTIGDEILYDEAWMRRQNYSSVVRSKRAMYVETSEIRGLRIRGSEAGWGKAWKSEVKDYGIGSKMGQKTTAFSGNR